MSGPIPARGPGVPRTRSRDTVSKRGEARPLDARGSGLTQLTSRSGLDHELTVTDPERRSVTLPWTASAIAGRRGRVVVRGAGRGGSGTRTHQAQGTNQAHTKNHETSTHSRSPLSANRADSTGGQHFTHSTHVTRPWPGHPCGHRREFLGPCGISVRYQVFLLRCRRYRERRGLLLVSSFAQRGDRASALRTTTSRCVCERRGARRTRRGIGENPGGSPLGGIDVAARVSTNRRKPYGLQSQRSLACG